MEELLEAISTGLAGLPSANATRQRRSGDEAKMVFEKDLGILGAQIRVQAGRAVRAIFRLGWPSNASELSANH